MDNIRHRQILRALRPHGADQNEPEAQPALAAAAADPLLGAWLAREQAFDRAFADKLLTAAPPPELRASIFAAVARREPSQGGWPLPRGLRLRRPVATLVAALAAAASLAVLAVLVWPRQSGPVDVRDIILAATSVDADATALEGRPLAEVRDWLAARGAPVPGELPAALAPLGTAGTGVVVLEGVTSSLVTFETSGLAADLGGRRLLLFTLPRQSCSSAGLSREPTVREERGRAVAVWRDARSVYILATDAPADALRRFLGATGDAGGTLAAIDSTNARRVVRRPG